jgi:hypothetical protein
MIFLTAQTHVEGNISGPLDVSVNLLHRFWRNKSPVRMVMVCSQTGFDPHPPRMRVPCLVLTCTSVYYSGKQEIGCIQNFGSVSGLFRKGLA